MKFPKIYDEATQAKLDAWTFVSFELEIFIIKFSENCGCSKRYQIQICYFHAAKNFFFIAIMIDENASLESEKGEQLKMQRLTDDNRFLVNSCENNLGSVPKCRWTAECLHHFVLARNITTEPVPIDWSELLCENTVSRIFKLAAK